MESGSTETGLIEAVASANRCQTAAAALTEIWGEDAYRLIDVPWEGVTRDESGEFFICVFLANNQWGLVAILPDLSRTASGKRAFE